MSLSNGIAVVPIYKHLKDPAEAPAPFMIAMANDTDNLHFFLDREALLKLSNDMRRLVYDT